MKLYLTATSERGKPVTKSSNESISIRLTQEKRGMFDIIFHGDYIEVMKYTDGKTQTIEYMRDDNICPKYKAQILPDEDGNCSLCGQKHERMI